MSTLILCLEGIRWTCSRVESVLIFTNIPVAFDFSVDVCCNCERFYVLLQCHRLLVIACLECSDFALKIFRILLYNKSISMDHSSPGLSGNFLLSGLFCRMARAKPRTHLFTVGWPGLSQEPTFYCRMARAKPRTHLLL